MKWKSLKRGLAVFLSALMITSSVPVHAEEPDPPEQTKVNISEESTEGGELDSTEEAKPADESEPAVPKESESTGESATVEESESTRESMTEEESESTEESTTEEESELTEESTTEEESESTEESTTEEESESTEESTTEEESKSTEESTTEEESESTEDFTTEKSTVEETTEEETTEIETETETETETAEVIAFADIEDVVTFNTGNMEISVIPSDDYSDDLFEACLDENIFVQPFEEDGSFTIEAEADVFFPYEVQFQYDGSTENKWFMNPDDSISVKGHTFYIDSEDSGDVITQMKLSVGEKTITVYPEKKEFTNDGGISPYSLLPLEEKNLRVDLSEFTPVELTMVSMRDVFAGERELKDTENVMWVNSEDDYIIKSPGDRLDLSSGSFWQMIVGSADQLDPGNVRYDISVTRKSSYNWLLPAVYTQNSAGERKEIRVVSSNYYDYNNELYFQVAGDDIGDAQEVYIGLKINPDAYANKRFSRMEVYEGEFSSAYDAQQGKQITSQIWDVDMAQKDAGYFVNVSDLSNDSYTLVTYDADQNVTGCLSINLYLTKTSNSISVRGLYQRTENGLEYVYGDSSYGETDGVEMYTKTLQNGYAADGEYYLLMTYYKDGITSNSEVTAAYVGKYDSINEAKQEKAVEVTSLLFNNDTATGGYKADFSKGVDFSVFVEKDGGARYETYYFNYKTVAAEEVNLISINSLFQRTESGSENVQKGYSHGETDGVEMYTVTLKKGYAADSKYCLSMTYKKNGVASNSEVTAAYVGKYDSIDEAKQANAEEVTSSLFSDNTAGGYEADFSKGIDFSVFVEKDDGARYEKYYYNYKTIEYEEVNSIFVKPLYQKTEGGQMNVQLSSSYSTINEKKMYTVTLKKGYAADGKYCLSMTYYKDGITSNSEVTAAYVGIYDSIDEAKQANAEEVTSSLFHNVNTEGGYEADFSKGVDFSVFVVKDKLEKLEKYYYNYRVVEDTSEPDLSSLEPIVTFDGLVDADGNEIAFYRVGGRMDSYSEYEFLTMIVEPDVDLSNVAPVFSLDERYDGKGVNLYAAGSSTPEVSGESYHNFSNGALQYTVATQTMIDGKDESRQRNYWLRILQKDSDKLYVNSLADPGAKTKIDDEGVIHSIREIHIDTYQGDVHNILLINMGTAAITGLSAELTSDVLKLDDYWTLKGTFELSGYSTIEKDTAYGELPNMAKICLRAQDGKVSDADDLGTLTIKEDGTPIMEFQLTGSVGDPHMITQEIPQAVKYVPYGTMIQNSNKYYDWNTVIYEQSGGNLPEGMQLLQSGELYGVPKEAGRFSFEVKMTNISSREGIEFQPDIKEFTLEVLENTDDNVDAATDEDYAITKRISDFSTDNVQDQLFVSNGLFDNYKYVYIDGNKLSEESDFTAESGSTRITIRSETLDKLDEGTHTIGVEFRNDDNELKRAAQNFTVEVKKDEDNKVDDPSDEDNKGDNPSDEDNKGDTPSDEDNKGDNPSDEDNKGDAPSDENDKGDDNNKEDPGKADENSSDFENNSSSSNNNSSNSSSSSNAATAAKADNTSVEIVPVEGFVYKEGYTMSQANVSQNHILRAALLNQYYGQNMYLNVVFGADFGLTIDMAGVPMTENDVEIAYTFVSDPIIAPEFDVIHAIPNAIKPLGFEAVFNFHIGDTYIGKKAYIYVLNESGTGYDFIGETIVNEIGNIAFTSRNVTDVIIFVEK